MSCPSCAADVPPGARFCPSCGHPFGQVVHEERRIVTVLFADLVGFTSLAEFIDPEQAKRLVDGCFARLVEEITAFGGRVDKILGDGILALFGAPVAHEDDPERAVRAALRMQDTLAVGFDGSLVRRMEAGDDAGGGDAGVAGAGAIDAGAAIRMRVGINTGEVLVGTLTGNDYTAMGDVVNTASRLQSLAPPGRVIVGEGTYLLTAHTIDYEPAGELTARGREQRVPAWLAVAASAPPGDRRRHRVEVPMVGRDAELTIGLRSLEHALGHRRGVVVAVTGESGVGKRRLVSEWLAALGRCTDDVNVLEGHCMPYGEVNAYWPVANALAAHYEIDTMVSDDQVREQIIDRALASFPDIDPDELDRVADLLMHLHGHPSPLDQLDAASARSAIHWGIGKVFERTALQRPTVLVIDNMHWADPLLLDLLEHLVTTLARHPFALITAMRPGSDLAWPPHNERISVLSIVLHPLTHDETDELATRLLAGQDADDGLLADLYDRSGGNPLFLQELAALTSAGTSAVELPSTLRTMIGARLDQLSSVQRQVLDNAATLGTAGEIAALADFAAAMGQPFDVGTVRELDDLGLLEVIGRRWEFRSDSVREAAYQTLTKASRALRHAGVAHALASNPKLVNSGAVIDELAHHLAASAELQRELGQIAGVPPTVRADAIRALTAAGARALDAGSLHLVVRDATRAMDLLEPGAAQDIARAELRLMRANALVEQRSYDAAHADLEAVLAYATEHRDPAVQGEARRLLGTLHHAEGRLDLARVELGQAVEILRAAERPELLAQALRSRGYIELFGGSLTDAEWFFGEADGLFHELGDRRGMAWIEQHRAWLKFLSGDMHDARAGLVASAQTLDELGDRNGVGWVLGLLAYVELHLCHFDEAERLAEQVRREAAERGDGWATAMMLALQASLRLWRGRLDEAAGLAEDARRRFRKMDDPLGAAQAMGPLLRTHVALGKLAAAQRTEEELLALGEMAAVGAAPLLAVAGAAMHRGDGPTAVMHATRAITEMRAAGGEADEPQVVLAMGQAQSGRLDEAAIALDALRAEAWEHPFPHAVAAVVHALRRQPVEALADAAWVERTATSSSYLDRVLALVAAAAAHAQLGDPRAATLSADAAVAVALSVGDVVAIAIATRCSTLITGQRHPAADDHTPLGDGWCTVLDQLVDPSGTLA